jgi:hypothetical protein
MCPSGHCEQGKGGSEGLKDDKEGVRDLEVGKKHRKLAP